MEKLREPPVPLPTGENSQQLLSLEKIQKYIIACINSIMLVHGESGNRPTYDMYESL